ncbi:MAG: hypothetical protein ACFFDI_17220 [Promethearchaeota archaeon]
MHACDAMTFCFSFYDLWKEIRWFLLYVHATMKWLLYMFVENSGLEVR